MDVKQAAIYIKNNVNLLDYMRVYCGMDFKKVGGSYKACCPIGNHDNKTPSFSVPEGENFFNCFGCGAKGNIISFVEQYCNCSNEDAIKKICSDVGITVNDIRKASRQQSFDEGKLKQTIEYGSILIKKNKKALEYLLETRKLSKEVIKDFLLGATEDDGKNDYSNRIVFPFQANNSNSIVAFGYGYIGDSSNYQTKYINDSNNEYFTKSNILYGYNQALKYIKECKVVNIVEGYFDVLSMHQAGIRNTVGVVCASISDEQVNVIKRLNCSVNVILDNDNAGDIGTRRSINKFVENNIKVNVIFSYEFNDADELCKKYKFDKEAILKVLKKKYARWNFILYRQGIK